MGGGKRGQESKKWPSENEVVREGKSGGYGAAKSGETKEISQCDEKNMEE